LIEGSSGDRQRLYIGVFGALTYTRFPTIPWGFCGNSSPASIDRAIQEGQKRQQESVSEIKSWWAQNKNKPPEEWLEQSLRRAIRAKTEAMGDRIATERDDESRRLSYYHQVRDHADPHAGAWRPSVYDMLVNEFERAPPDVKPYVLRLIGSTRHPDAVEFIAPNLESQDPNLQHVAVAALRDLKVTDYNQAIGRILRGPTDRLLALEVIEALEELAGADAIEDLTYALDHPEISVSDWAERALRPFLVSHADQLRVIARSHPRKAVRRKLTAVLDQAEIAELVRTETEGKTRKERIAVTRVLLRSTDPTRLKLGIAHARGHPELLPDVLELIRSDDRTVRRDAVEIVKKLGVPMLTVENAPCLMGYSVELDRQIAAYCYAKYGLEAVPLMKKAAFDRHDLNPQGTRFVSFPAVGLIRALVREDVPGVEADVLRLVKDDRSDSRHLRLLGLLDDPESAALVGEFLHHEKRHHRLDAIRIVRARNLTQHADRLFELASWTADSDDTERLGTRGEQESKTTRDGDRGNRSGRGGPYEQCEATLALIELDDPRAWKAVVNCLNGEQLEWRHQSMVSPSIVTDFGAMVARLKGANRDEIRKVLLDELSGKNRERVTVSLTTAFCVEPETVDAELLWTIATSSAAHEKARVLAAVALSKLGEPRVIPVLHELIRLFIAPTEEGQSHSGYPPGFSILLSPSLQRHLHDRSTSLLDYDVRELRSTPTLRHHHVDMGLALRRLGDETLVPELVDALSDARRGFNLLAYHLLGGMVGVRAHAYAREWMQSNQSESPQLRAVLASALLDLEVPAHRVIPLLIEDDDTLLTATHLFSTDDGAAAADALLEAYQRSSHRRSYARLRVLEALCRFGDPRGIALAVEDPLLIASLVHYLPDAPGVEFEPGRFEYNRIEDAMQVQAWYKQHASRLRWDPEASQFRLVRKGSDAGS
jgi:HEAT repeat protein